MTTTKWTKEKIDSITSKSVSTKFPVLLNEWIVKDEMGLNPNHDSVCELCGQSNLYYEYFISNSESKNEMLIGSVCINLFFEVVREIIVMANEQLVVLKKTEMKRHLDRLFIKKLISEINESDNLGKLNRFESGFYPSVTELVLNQQKLSPKQGEIFIKIVAKITNNNEMILTKIGKLIRINLGRDKYKEQLYATSPNDWKYLKYALSKQQMEKYF